MKRRSRSARRLALNTRPRKALTRTDPTRLGTLRRHMLTQVRAQFARLKGRIVHLLLTESAFQPTLNATADQPRDEHGRWVSEAGAGHTIEVGLPGGKVAFTKQSDGKWKGTNGQQAPEALIKLWHKKGMIAPSIAKAPSPVSAAPNPARALPSVTAVLASLKRINVPDRTGITPLIPELYDKLKQEHPSLTEKGFHQILDDARSAGNVVLQRWSSYHHPEYWDRLPEHPISGRSAWVQVTNRFQFQSSDAQLASFQDWLRTQFDSTVHDDQLWQKYVQRGFERGAGRAYDDTPSPQGTAAGATADYLLGGRDGFLRTTLARPTTVAKVKLLAGRTFTDLKNVTHDMGTRMGRVLADGLVRGDNPRLVAAALAREVDIGRGRAEKVARTELVRCHAEGQLQAFRDLGVEELGVEVEFSVADGSACEQCQALDGTITPIDEASGVIPVHPECRCAWVPAARRRPARNPRRPTANYSPEQVRGPDGKWLGKSARHTAALNKLENGLGNSEGLSAQQYDHYHESLTKVVGRMTEEAADRVSRNLKAARFYPSTQVMTDAVAQTDATAGRIRAEGKQIGGSYHSGNGRLSLDGPFETVDKVWNPSLTTEGVYAHELGHVIDGTHMFGRISNTPEWQSAFTEERSKIRAYISPYGASSAVEGFAEFSRLLHTRDGNSRTAAELFPRCYAVWESHGLVPKSPTGNALAGAAEFLPLIPDLFSEGMLTDSGLFIDIIHGGRA